MKHKVIRRQEIRKIIVEINEIENRKMSIKLRVDILKISTKLTSKRKFK
jgi:hypothetical protein